MITLAEYYIANKEPDSDWVIIPRTNISAYLGSATYMESYEGKISDGFMEKKPEMGSVSAVKVNNNEKKLPESVLCRNGEL
ncbi:MAG: hypothetical protein J6A97_01230 [Clostridia bacterium]|nr:hypothetical protein [Clostridia bacterium]